MSNKLLIKREHEDYDEVEFFFRYAKIASTDFEFLNSETLDLDKKVNKLKDSTYVVTFELTPDLDPSLFKKINTQLNIEESKYGLWVSFTSEYDHSGYRLPNYVKDFYLETGGQFDCSIITLC